MKTEFAIIGGGIAGLSAAIRLAELGKEPLVIEGGSYPTHKICGEFLSPECLSCLKRWNIQPIPINQATIRTSLHHYVFPFPTAAGGLSHLELDPALVKHALSLGVQFRINTAMQAFRQKKHMKDPHLIELSSNETIEAKNALIAAGRFHIAQKPSYIGFKAHFDSKVNHLEMFSFPRGYLGISPIENNKANVAGLIKIDVIEPLNPQDLISQNPYLHQLLPLKKNLFDQWMTAPIPEFGIRKTPDWIDCYFIGDAAVTIPPACGSGLSLAIFGGQLAAEYATKQKYLEFKSMWAKRCSTPLFWAKIWHRLLLNPKLSNSAITLCKYFPSLPQNIFKITRMGNEATAFREL